MGYEELNRLNEDLCPQSESFKWSPDYDSRDILLDQQLLQARENSAEYKKRGKDADSAIMEATFINVMEQDDWLYEWDRFGEDAEFEAISSIPTSKEDDNFNHIDLISVISNKDTEYVPIPFAIDLTYNADSYNQDSIESLGKKFARKHLYGKKPTVPDDTSEFGRILTEKGSDGTTRLITKPLFDRERYGMKIPGFAAAKYYQDSGSSYPKASEGCRINVMPRFVVAFNPELTAEIASGDPDRKYAEKYGEAAYKQRKSEIKKAKSRAKWCMLTELSEQASDIRSYLDNLPEDKKRWIDSDELAIAKKQIAVMEKYFKGALEVGKMKALEDPIERDGQSYASHENICQTVSTFSTITYRDTNHSKKEVL